MHIEHRAAAHHRQVRFSDLTFLLKIVSSKPPAAAVNGMNFHKMLLEFSIDLPLIVILEGTAETTSLAHTDPNSDLTFVIKIVSLLATASNDMDSHKLLVKSPLRPYIRRDSVLDFDCARYCGGTLTCSHRSKFCFDFCDKDCQFTSYCCQCNGLP